MRKFVPWLITAIALTVGFSSLAVASNHEIKACASNSKGALRLADESGDCKSNEIPLSWAVAGPTGPTGPPADLQFYTVMGSIPTGVAECAQGDAVTGGGFDVPSGTPASQSAPRHSKPYLSGDGLTQGWQTFSHNDGNPGPNALQPYAVCVAVNP